VKNSSALSAESESAASWAQRSLVAIWHPCTQMKWHPDLLLVPIECSEGPWLTNHDGRRYFDAIDPWWVCLLIHQLASLLDCARKLHLGASGSHRGISIGKIPRYQALCVPRINGTGH